MSLLVMLFIQVEKQLTECPKGRRKYLEGIVVWVNVLIVCDSLTDNIGIPRGFYEAVQNCSKRVKAGLTHIIDRFWKNIGAK
jgi:hypothetical protein